VKHAAENGEAEAGTVPSEAITSTTSAAAPVENEDVDKAAESIVADVHEESVEAAEQGSLQSAEADDGAADKLAEDSPSHAAGSEEESSVVDDIPAVAESQELSSEVAEGHMAAAGGEESVGSEEATVEESGVPAGDAQSVEGSDEADRQILQGDQISEVVPGGPADADLGTPVPDDKVESSPEDSTVVSDTTEEVPKAAEVGAAEKSWQSEASAAELVGSATDEVQRKDPPGPLEGTEGSMEDEVVNLRPLEHAESTASNSCRSETNVPPAVEESGSDVESSPLLSSTSGISSTEVSEAVHALENETDAAEPAIVGNPSSGQEGLKVGSRKKKKKEFLARADAAGNTADLYNAYKAPEEKKSVEVKRSEVSGTGSSGSDVKDSAVAQDKSLPKEVDDWEDAAELPTPAIPVVHGVDCGDRKYTRDFLMTFRDQNREFPPNFEIRHDIAELLLDKDRLFADGMTSPARNLDRQASGGGQRLERRGSGIQQGPDEDRWTRQPGLVPSPGRNQPGDARMDMSMQGGFRPGQGMQPGLISPVPQQWAGMPGQPGYPGLVQRGPGSMPLQHFMAPGPPGRSSNGVDGDSWHRQPTAGGKGPGLIPSPRTPLPAIHKAENRYEVGKVSDEEQAKQRLIKGILNKLTPQNFDKLFVQVQEANIDSATTLTGVISQIFDKALMEPTFCEMYAQFCVKLAGDLPEFTENDEKITFKRVLLNKCQEEFERGEREQEEAEKDEEEHVEIKMTPEEREEKRLKARRRMLGNIRFIGELYKKSMLTERIMHECIKKLLGDIQNPDEEDVEALCKLMSTIGRIIDHHKAKEHIDAYFRRMESLSNNTKLSSRLRFMLKDCIELRRNGWQERRKVDGPKKIDEVRRDAVQERQQAARGDRLGRGPSVGGGSSRGRMGPGPEFGMRGPPSPMYSSGPMGAGKLQTILHCSPEGLMFLMCCNQICIFHW
jgi:translation initiation factor 4G